MPYYTDLEEDELTDEEKERKGREGRPAPQQAPPPPPIGTPIAAGPPAPPQAIGQPIAAPAAALAAPEVRPAPVAPAAPVNPSGSVGTPISPVPATPAPTSPVGVTSRPMTMGTPIGTPPIAPGPSSARAAYEAALQKGPPQLHGFKKFMDIAARATNIGNLIEPNIPGSPGYYQAHELPRLAAGARAERQGEQDTQAEEERKARIEHEKAQAGALLNPPPKVGLTPEETTIHDLMTGDNGKPRINPDTKQPYQYDEAYGHVMELKTGAKPVPQKNAKEQIQEQINAELAKPKPDQKTVKGLQDRLRAIDPFAADRLADAETRAANAAENATSAKTDREEKNSMKWVTWNDPKTGKTTAGPLSMAKKAGATEFAEVPGAEVTSIQNARHAVNLADKQGKTPEDMGVLQLVESLNKDGKLGVAASRWNNFMTRGIGSAPDDDPRIVALLNKGELLMTASMQAHFGASGGRSPQMLQHFLNMANATKMDGPTLDMGFRSVTNYMRDRAMLPEKPATGGLKNPY